MNAYLKEIGNLCGIEKNLTTHIPRYTFATTVALSNNVSMEAVSKMLGHSNTLMSNQYARITESLISQNMQQVFQKYTRNA
ncbi:tyrosine-type recombinase/integrase [candidate division KSB1 bacterium]